MYIEFPDFSKYWHSEVAENAVFQDTFLSKKTGI